MGVRLGMGARRVTVAKIPRRRWTADRRRERENCSGVGGVGGGQDRASTSRQLMPRCRLVPPTPNKKADERSCPRKRTQPPVLAITSTVTVRPTNLCHALCGVTTDFNSEPQPWACYASPADIATASGRRRRSRRRRASYQQSQPPVLTPVT
jgi:hypothetical protein